MKTLTSISTTLTTINIWKIFLNSHREKAPSNETPALTKSTNMDIWVVGTTNQLFIRGSLTETKFSKSSYWQTPFFVIGTFCSHHFIFICLDIGFWYDAFSILLLSTKKRYSSFLKKVFIFQEIYFKAEVLKTFKIFTDCNMKTCWSLKRRTILKFPSTVL